ncbi:MAG: CoA transferase [Acidobacteria bacterium]|nr:CoA transferase [Acidobacteriota bacterium]
MTPHALEGIKVLDLTRLLPGAVATMMLGDFGAEVLKIEEPGVGDPMRNSAVGDFGKDAADTYFLATNRNKYSMTLNLKDPRGRDLLRKLVEEADVLVEGNRPGVMARLGLGYEDLRDVNPRLIYCAITGYGQSGPYALLAGHDANYLATAGLLSLNGQRDGAPVIPGVQLADLAGGSLHAVIGILLALQARTQTGRGQFVDVSMMEAALSLMYLPLASYLAAGKQAPRGNDGLSGKYACYQIYETSDERHLALGALEAKFWASACHVLECEEFVAQQFKREAQPLMQATLRRKFKTRTAEDWLKRFAEVDSCIARVNDLAEAVNDPQLQAREMFVELTHPERGVLRQIAPTVRLSDTPGAAELPPPALGEHTSQVLQALGYDEAQRDAFKQDGVI